MTEVSAGFCSQVSKHQDSSGCVFYISLMNYHKVSLDSVSMLLQSPKFIPNTTPNHLHQVPFVLCCSQLVLTVASVLQDKA